MTAWWLRKSNPKGFEIKNYDQPTGVPCPTGCGSKVVYNGNYFCECGWALATDVDPTKHEGMSEFLDALRAAGWWDSYRDRGSAETREKMKRESR